MLLYGRLAGPTAQIRAGDFLYGGKILEGTQRCLRARKFAVHPARTQLLLSTCQHFLLTTALASCDTMYFKRLPSPALAWSGFIVPRWIANKRAAGKIDEEVAATWELIVQGVFRPNTGACILRLRNVAAAVFRANGGTVCTRRHLLMPSCQRSFANRDTMQADAHARASTVSYLLAAALQELYTHLRKRWRRSLLPTNRRTAATC